MSWDILVLSIPADVQTLDGLNDKSKLNLLGTYEYVFISIREVWPTVENVEGSLKDGYHQISADGYSIEFFLKETQVEIDGLMFMIRGGGDVVPHLKQLCDQTGWRIYDISQSAFIDFGPKAEDSWRKWQAYRDRVIGNDKDVLLQSDE
jgi:hypothetical protein